MTQPSRADHPDLDWSQVRETVSMLNLVVSQLGWSMRDGDISVTSLTSSFASMVSSTDEILQAAESMDECEQKQKILQRSHSIMQQVQQAIVAFQFYDRLSQRLNHAADSLGELSVLVGDPLRLYNPQEWYKLQEIIRHRYTTEADKVMFDAIINGSTFEEAIELFDKTNHEAEPSEISFF